MKDRVKNQRGFTLLEVLVALGIFSVGMLGIAAVQVTSIRYNTNSNSRGIIGGVAQMVLEDFLTLEDDNPIFSADRVTARWSFDPAVNNTIVDETDNTINNLRAAGGGTYLATREILTDTPIAGIAQINIVVTGPQGRLESLTGFKRFLP